MIKVQSITRKRNTYPVLHADWAAAMTYLSSQRNNLQLPLKGNGYLLETLASRAEKIAAKQEAAAIEEQRHTAPRNSGMRRASEVITENVSKPSTSSRLPDIDDDQAKRNQERLRRMIQGNFSDMETNQGG